MLSYKIRQQLQHIIRGAIVESQGDRCQEVRNYLCTGFSTSRTVKKDFEGQSIIKEEQAVRLRKRSLDHGFGITRLSSNWQYLTLNKLDTKFTLYDGLANGKIGRSR